MSTDIGLVGKVPTEIWLAYEKRAADYAAMHGNGSAALKVGILRLTLEAWLSGHSDAVSNVLDAYDAETRSLPLGHEMPTRGASTYNWRRSIVDELRARSTPNQTGEVERT